MHFAWTAVARQLVRLAPQHVPNALHLLPQIEVKVLRKAQDESKNMIGDDVAEDAAHVGYDHRRGDQVGKQKLLHARRRRLHPAQLLGGREQRRREVAEQRIGVSDLAQRLVVIGRVDDRHRRRGVNDFRQPRVRDRWMDKQFHESTPKPRDERSDSRGSPREIILYSPAPLHKSRSMTPPVAAEPSAAPSQRRKVFLHRLAQRHPFVYWFLLVVLSNAAASLFNFEYNLELIVHRLMDERQQAVFWQAAFYYNIIAYPLCLGLMLVLIVPLAGCRRRMQFGDGMPAADLEYCRRRVVNFPLIQVVLNFLGWIPGAVYFPAIVCGLGGGHEAHEIWTRFIISFVISAVYATVQTFFLMEWFLVAVVYPELFRDARPAEVPGRWPIPFVVRMLFLWLAVAVMPLVAVTAMACYSEP